MQSVGVPILVLAIVLGRWLLQNATKAAPDKGGQDGGSPQPHPPTPLAATNESEEERMRRFMEALGLPADSVPPPKVAGAVPEQPVAPPLPERRAPAQAPRRERRQVAPPPAQTVRKPAFQREKTFVEQAMTASPEAAYRMAPPPGAPAQTRGEPAAPRVPLRVELRQPGALRKAFILREVFGPPKALQSARQAANFSPL